MAARSRSDFELADSTNNMKMPWMGKADNEADTLRELDKMLEDDGQ